MENSPNRVSRRWKGVAKRCYDLLLSLPGDGQSRVLTEVRSHSFSKGKELSATERTGRSVFLQPRWGQGCGVEVTQKAEDLPVEFATALRCITSLAALGEADRQQAVHSLTTRLLKLPCDGPPTCWSCGYQYKTIDNRTVGVCPECFIDWLPFLDEEPS